MLSILSTDCAKNVAEISRQSRRVYACLLGAEGSGKTRFLAKLVILGESNRASLLTVTPTDQVSKPHQWAITQSYTILQNICTQMPHSTLDGFDRLIRLSVESPSIL